MKLFAEYFVELLVEPSVKLFARMYNNCTAFDE